jgi:hypothetical protein
LRRQEKRRNYNFEQKQGQRQRLKDAWREGTIDARRCLYIFHTKSLKTCYLSYMTAMGALNLKVDAKTRERFRAQVGEGNPEVHRRRTISIVMDDVDQNVRGLLNANRHRRGARLGDPRGIIPQEGAGVLGQGRGGRRGARSQRGARPQRSNYEVLPNGRLVCPACLKNYLPTTIARYWISYGFYLSYNSFFIIGMSADQLSNLNLSQLTSKCLDKLLNKAFLRLHLLQHTQLLKMMFST